MPIKSLKLHILPALRLMLSNLWFIVSRSNTVAVRFTLYTGAVLWGIHGLFYPETHFLDIARLLSIHVEYVASLVQCFLPLGLITYGSSSLILLLLKYKSNSLTLQSSLAGAFFFTLALNLDMVVHYLTDGNIQGVEVPMWYAAILAWWVLIRDITKENIWHLTQK